MNGDNRGCDEYMSAMNHRKVAVESVANGVIIASATVAAAIGAQLVSNIIGLSPQATTVLANSAIGMVAGAALFWAGQKLYRAQKPDSNTDRRDIIDDNDFMQIINEHDDGYGLALWNKDDGIALLSFTPDEIADEVHIYEDEMDDALEMIEEARD